MRMCGNRAAGGECGYATIIAQRPKLARFIPAMRENLAADLGLQVSAVNVKGKTNEKMGYLGRSEASGGASGGALLAKR